MTLASDDVQMLEAHRIIIAALSPVVAFFLSLENLLYSQDYLISL